MSVVVQREAAPKKVKKAARKPQQSQPLHAAEPAVDVADASDVAASSSAAAVVDEQQEILAPEAAEMEAPAQIALAPPEEVTAHPPELVAPPGAVSSSSSDLDLAPPEEVAVAAVQEPVVVEDASQALAISSPELVLVDPVVDVSSLPPVYPSLAEMSRQVSEEPGDEMAGPEPGEAMEEEEEGGWEPTIATATVEVGPAAAVIMQLHEQPASAPLHSQPQEPLQVFQPPPIFAPQFAVAAPTTGQLIVEAPPEVIHSLQPPAVLQAEPLHQQLAEPSAQAIEQLPEEHKQSAVVSASSLAPSHLSVSSLLEEQAAVRSELRQHLLPVSSTLGPLESDARTAALVESYTTDMRSFGTWFERRACALRGPFFDLVDQFRLSQFAVAETQHAAVESAHAADTALRHVWRLRQVRIDQKLVCGDGTQVEDSITHVIADFDQRPAEAAHQKLVEVQQKGVQGQRGRQERGGAVMFTRVTCADRVMRVAACSLFSLRCLFSSGIASVPRSVESAARRALLV